MGLLAKFIMAMVQDTGHMDTEGLVTDLSTTITIEARKILIMIDLSDYPKRLKKISLDKMYSLFKCK